MDKAVVKAFNLLEILAESDTPMGVTELSKGTELGKSNVHRLLQTLLGLGFVQKTDDNNYQASLKLWELGGQIISRLSIRELARPYMKLLSDQTGETVHLSELHGAEVLYIDKIESREPVRAYTQLGGRAPAYCTATGKVMLAYQDADRIEDCFESATSHTPKTITDHSRFLVEANIIRTRRFAINRGEWRNDVIGIAVPVANASGHVEAALGLSAPASRLHVDELETLTPKLLDYAEKLSNALGCSAARWAGLGQT